MHTSRLGVVLALLYVYVFLLKYLASQCTPIENP